jgi:hypothetical protein
MIDNDTDEVFISVCTGMGGAHAADVGGSALTALERLASRVTMEIAERLRLAEAALEVFCEDEGGSILETSITEMVLLWEEARGARFIFTDEETWIIASGRAGLLTWFKEYGYDKYDNELWRRMEPEESLTINCDAAGNPDLIEDAGNNSPITKTVTQWLMEIQRSGLLCGTLEA